MREQVKVASVLKIVGKLTWIQYRFASISASLSSTYGNAVKSRMEGHVFEIMVRFCSVRV